MPFVCFITKLVRDPRSNRLTISSTGKRSMKRFRDRVHPLIVRFVIAYDKRRRVFTNYIFHVGDARATCNKCSAFRVRLRARCLSSAEDDKI